MRCTRLPLALFCLMLAGSFASAQTTKPATPSQQPTPPPTSTKGSTASDAQKAQRQKMTDCNKEASAEKLTGQKRKDFMKSCLASDPDTAKKTLTAQQQKMADCNKEATAKGLKGAERKKFMSDCLKTKPAA